MADISRRPDPRIVSFCIFLNDFDGFCSKKKFSDFHPGKYVISYKLMFSNFHLK